VGGLYGVALGQAFFGESMFARETDASKVALVHLVERLRRADFRVIDCQQNTAHLASLGAREIPRADFARLLQESIQYPLSGERWL
jgi:leucyl/phenylalanyl-tRNA--protein transferase